MTQDLIKEADKFIESHDKQVLYGNNPVAREAKAYGIIKGLREAQKEQQQEIQSLKKTCSDMFIKKDNAVCDYQRLLNKLGSDGLAQELADVVEEYGNESVQGEGYSIAKAVLEVISNQLKGE